METRARYIRSALFVLAIIVAGLRLCLLAEQHRRARRRASSTGFASKTPSPGLQVGAAVQFNGIRVGEVTGLQLDKDHPAGSSATIAVSTRHAAAADTKVGVDFQGLMGRRDFPHAAARRRAPLLARRPENRPSISSPSPAPA